MESPRPSPTTITLLIVVALMAMYLGSYFALKDEERVTLNEDGSVWTRIPHYRIKGLNTFYWPLKEADFRIRPSYWACDSLWESHRKDRDRERARR